MFPYGPGPRPEGEPTPVISCSTSPSIAWVDAKNHLNEEVAIVGDIFIAKQSPGLGTDLYLGDSSSPDEAVLVRVPDDSRHNFDLPPEQLYVGKTVCVIGVVEAIDQRLVLELDSDKYITILADSGLAAKP
ncbi:MAG TPA: hypothetical protein VJB57_11205 [Dehalococcoidia bacterium]|nr:hypothetical protein [Dehalococcoidia bacterium]